MEWLSWSLMCWVRPKILLLIPLNTHILFEPTQEPPPRCGGSDLQRPWKDKVECEGRRVGTARNQWAHPKIASVLRVQRPWGSTVYKPTRSLSLLSHPSSLGGDASEVLPRPASGPLHPGKGVSDPTGPHHWSLVCWREEVFSLCVTGEDRNELREKHKITSFTEVKHQDLLSQQSKLFPLRTYELV